jgi:hypothetical protein
VRSFDVLLRSSEASWLTTSTEVEPDFEKHKQGFPPPVTEDYRSHPLGASIVGGFASAVAKQGGTHGKQLLEHSPPDTRMVIFGSSAFVSDDVIGLAQQLESELALSNLMLVHNSIDWALADIDLLEIRAQTSARRALTVEKDKIDNWRLINIMIVVLGLAAVVVAAVLLRRSVKPVLTAKGAA